MSQRGMPVVAVAAYSGLTMAANHGSVTGLLTMFLATYMQSSFLKRVLASSSAMMASYCGILVDCHYHTDSPLLVSMCDKVNVVSKNRLMKPYTPVSKHAHMHVKFLL